MLKRETGISGTSTPRARAFYHRAPAVGCVWAKRKIALDEDLDHFSAFRLGRHRTGFGMLEPPPYRPDNNILTEYPWCIGSMD
jgi:hypothetical protein